MTDAGSLKPCFFSAKALSLPQIPPKLRKLGRDLSSGRTRAAVSAPLVVAFASELVERTSGLPAWSTGSTTRYLILVDVPLPVVLRVVSMLELRRPDLRAHPTTDHRAVQRLLVSCVRHEPFLGIVDAFVWDESLNIVTGDFTVRSFPLKQVPLVSALSAAEQESFEIDEDGSYLCWPDRGIHLGVSQILQEADPMYLADVAIERNRQDHTGAALRAVREEKGLRQSDIRGLSERQVRRLEEGISRLRLEAAEKFAAAFKMELASLLDDIARRAGEMRSNVADPPARTRARTSARRKTNQQ